MKRCPKCNFLYLDSDEICDLDGTQLVADGSQIGGVLVDQSVRSAEQASESKAGRQLKPTWKILIEITVASLIIGLALFLIYQMKSRSILTARQAPQGSQATIQSSETPPASGVAQQTTPLVASHAAPVATATPSAKPEISPTAKPSPSPRTDSTRVVLSSSPVSTSGVGKPGRGPVVIRLTDGSSVQADEVWRTKAGLWYRRKGLVTLIKPNRVKAIEKAFQ